MTPLEEDGGGCLGGGSHGPHEVMVEENLIVAEPVARANSFVGTEV